jgi:hypothetical protein
MLGRATVEQHVSACSQKLTAFCSGNQQRTCVALEGSRGGLPDSSMPMSRCVWGAKTACILSSGWDELQVCSWQMINAVFGRSAALPVCHAACLRAKVRAYCLHSQCYAPSAACMCLFTLCTATLLHVTALAGR